MINFSNVFVRLKFTRGGGGGCQGLLFISYEGLTVSPVQELNKIKISLAAYKTLLQIFQPGQARVDIYHCICFLFQPRSQHVSPVRIKNCPSLFSEPLDCLLSVDVGRRDSPGEPAS